jgi:ABC-type Fe3+-hydroxamate transport system substrate-binding protein
MRFTAILALSLLLAGCDSGGGEDDTQSSASSYDTQTSTDTADCYFVVDSTGNYVEVGEVGAAEAEEEVRTLKEGSIFIASCTGDVNVTFDDDTTTTTTDTNTNVDSNNPEVAQ